MRLPFISTHRVEGYTSVRIYNPAPTAKKRERKGLNTSTNRRPSNQREKTSYYTHTTNTSPQHNEKLLNAKPTKTNLRKLLALTAALAPPERGPFSGPSLSGERPPSAILQQQQQQLLRRRQQQHRRRRLQRRHLTRQHQLVAVLSARDVRRGPPR